MAKQKRTRDLEETADLDGAHPDRRKRVKYTEADAQLANIYNNLADEVVTVRIEAAGELLKNLSAKQPDREQRLDAAETRLIKGLCSGRKAARLGFSIALAEVFRLRFKLQSESDEGIKLVPSIEKLLKLTEAQGNVSGQERRDYLLGRRFAFQAVLHSDVGLQKDLNEDEWSQLVNCVFELAHHKQWLRRECGVFLYDYLMSPSGTKLPDGLVKALVTAAQEHKFLSTPEGVGLWITVADRFPGVKLPKEIWHHRNPLSSKERTNLSKVMLENSAQDEDAKTKAGARQITPSFAWKVLLDQLYKEENAKFFKHFWEETIVNGMFSTTSSAERRSLGLQVVSLAIATAPLDDLPQVLHKNILQCIFDQRAEANRYLFDAARAPLNQVVERAKVDPAAAGPFCRELIRRQLYNFDQATKTKTVESLIQCADGEGLCTVTREIEAALRSLHADKVTTADARVRQLADFTLSLVRQRKEPESIVLNQDTRRGTSHISWLSFALQNMVRMSYSSDLPGDKALLRSRLMSCLNALLSCPLEQAIKAPMFVVQEASAHAQTHASVKAAIQYTNEAYQRQAKDASSRAFALLFSLSIIQVCNEEPDAEAALEDLTVCYRSRDDKGDSLTMLVELLLSFISKPSALFRKLAEQAFSAFAGDLTADALQSLFDILGQKESLKGQQELFDDEGGQGADGGSSSDDGDGIDVEDASDVELVNGKEASGSDSNDGESETDSDSDSEAEAGTANGTGEDDEEAIFDRKLAEALGTAGMDDDADSDDDGSDMDDEQMMELEPHLATIFKERQKTTSKKQDKKDAKENIINFKNRVLDLLTIYVKSQYGNVLALDLILPLCVLVRTTTNKQTGEKAFALLKQYFDLASKHKALPQVEDNGAVFSVLEEVHAELRLGGLKLHANACSRSSLFLSKVLVGLDKGLYEEIADLYAKLQTDWYMGVNGGDKVQGSVFTEWVSWSIGTRKTD